MMNRFNFVSVGLLVILVFSSSRVSAHDGASWSTWRGPNRDGVVEGSWPDKLDEASLKGLWSKPFGDSYSGPVFDATSVFTTESVAGKERVSCLDRNTGELRWEYDWKGSLIVPPFALRNGSWIRATPATNGEVLLAGGIRDVLVAIDCKTGKERWRVDFGKNSGKVPDFGMVCSPLIDDEFVYIQAAKRSTSFELLMVPLFGHP